MTAFYKQVETPLLFDARAVSLLLMLGLVDYT